MSRIGRQPVVLDKGVKAVVAGHMVKVEGPKGKLELMVPEGYQIEIADSQGGLSALRFIMNRRADAERRKTARGPEADPGRRAADRG